eukprot:12409141-Karenia_brevis.AAC.1
MSTDRRLLTKASATIRLASMGVKRKSRVNVVAVRKPLLAMCDLEDAGHNIHICNGERYAEHKTTG